MTTQNQHEPVEIISLKDHLYLLNDNNESTGYVLIGTKKAAVIDTMNGYEDIYQVVRKITDLPLIVINTHGHPDHVCGDTYFEEIYIHPNDLEMAKGYIQEKGSNLSEITFKMIKEGDSFDLGGITLEIYEVPGHTPGSVWILDKEDRILFSGDSINRFTWMQLEESSSLEAFYNVLLRLEKLTGSYDTILWGHTRTGDSVSLYEENKVAVKEVIDGVGRELDEDYTYFGGTCKVHKCTQGNISIVYNE